MDKSDREVAISFVRAVDHFVDHVRCNGSGLEAYQFIEMDVDRNESTDEGIGIMFREAYAYRKALINVERNLYSILSSAGLDEDLLKKYRDLTSSQESESHLTSP